MKKIVFCCGNIREVFTYPEGVKPSEVDADFNKWCEKTGCEWREVADDFEDGYEDCF